jgi:hypothetical protein
MDDEGEESLNEYFESVFIEEDNREIPVSRTHFMAKQKNGLDRDSLVSEEKGIEQLEGLCAVNHQDQMVFIHGF